MAKFFGIQFEDNKESIRTGFIESYRRMTIVQATPLFRCRCESCLEPGVPTFAASIGKDLHQLYPNENIDRNAYASLCMECNAIYMAIFNAAFDTTGATKIDVDQTMDLMAMMIDGNMMGI